MIITPRWSKLPLQVALDVSIQVSNIETGHVNNRSLEVAREVIDALVAADKHEITIISRKVSSPTPLLRSQYLDRFVRI